MAVYGINNLGVIVGSYTDSFSREHGFVYIGGVFTTFDAMGGGNTAARGINDLGQIITSGHGGDFLARPVLSRLPWPYFSQGWLVWVCCASEADESQLQNEVFTGSSLA